MSFIMDFVRGMLFGVANVVPGVSGGTIAVVIGIFDKLIEAINRFFEEPKKYLPFLIPVGLGAVSGILAFSKLIEYCLDNYPLPTNLLFVGLVAGSLPLLYKKASSKKSGVPHYITAVIACAIVVLMAVLKTSESGAYYTDLTAKTGAIMFFGGFVAAVAMIIPGVSGSFMLVLMGLYETAIKSVSSLNIPLLIPMALGVVAGIFLISKIIEKLLKHAFSFTYFAILGLVVGSIIGLLYGSVEYMSGINAFTAVLSVITFLIGLLAALKLSGE